jgi:hypothetical protein
VTTISYVSGCPDASANNTRLPIEMNVRSLSLVRWISRRRKSPQKSTSILRLPTERRSSEAGADAVTAGLPIGGTLGLRDDGLACAGGCGGCGYRSVAWRRPSVGFRCSASLRSSSGCLEREMPVVTAPTPADNGGSKKSCLICPRCIGNRHQWISIECGLKSIANERIGPRGELKILSLEDISIGEMTKGSRSR